MMHYYSFLPLTQRSSTFSPLGKSSSRLLRFESVHNGNKVIRGYSVQQTENEDETRTESFLFFHGGGELSEQVRHFIRGNFRKIVENALFTWFYFFLSLSL